MSLQQRQKQHIVITLQKQIGLKENLAQILEIITLTLGLTKMNNIQKIEQLQSIFVGINQVLLQLWDRAVCKDRIDDCATTSLTTDENCITFRTDGTCTTKANRGVLLDLIVLLLIYKLPELRIIQMAIAIGVVQFMLINHVQMPNYYYL